MRSSVSRTPRQRIKSQMSPSPHKSILKEHKIHNQDKLKVYVKFKPQLSKQRQKLQCVSFINQKQLQIQTSLHRKIYTFDHVFEPAVGSEAVFNLGCSELIDEVLEGVHNDKINNNGLVFVYGNTGTGKTHTMGLIDEITEQSQGLVPDALNYIFKNRRHSVQQVCLSFCQIYKDEVYDLLDFEEQKKLNIRENQKSKEPYIEDLIMIQVKNYQQASQLINIGLEKRRIAEQKVNNRSSRGHGIITFYLKNENNINTGRVCFVDLAGCERIKQSQSKGATLNEALFINTSLSALQTLLMNISDQNVRSYRSNKLTRLLQPYFQFGKIRLFVTSNYESTQSIQFAKRCKGIRFHERQVRKDTDYNKVMKTPRRQAENNEMENNNSHRNNNKHWETMNGTNHNKRWNERIQQLKKEFMLKENNYLKCISKLVSIINKISETITSSVSKQSIHSSFSLPELFQHLPLQSKVNAKINIFQQKEQSILSDETDDTISKISSQLSTNLSQSKDDLSSILQRTQEIMRNCQQVGFSSIKKVTQLSQLADYKNVYKKQWFTSEIKNGLLQNKNSQLQKGILFMIENIQRLTSQNIINQQHFSKIAKKIKEYGIVLTEQSQQNRNKQKMKTPRKSLTAQNNENSQEPINQGRKRSLIYIQQEAKKN